MTKAKDGASVTEVRPCSLVHVWLTPSSCRGAGGQLTVEHHPNVRHRGGVTDHRDGRGHLHPGQAPDALPLRDGDTTENPRQLVRADQARRPLTRRSRPPRSHHDAVETAEAVLRGAGDLATATYSPRRSASRTRPSPAEPPSRAQPPVRARPRRPECQRAIRAARLPPPTTVGRRSGGPSDAPTATVSAVGPAGHPRHHC